MADLVVIVGVLAFFALSVAFVWGCDRIIGPDPDPDTVSPPGSAGSARSSEPEGAVR